MRRIRYAVAMSLDTYIAGPNGESDWIIMGPDIDFEEVFSSIDTYLLGRRTFEAIGRGCGGLTLETQTIVFSRTLRQEDYPKVTIVAENPEEVLTRLRTEPGKDIWLFGGGQLFRSLLESRLLDTVEVGVMPVLLGGGVPLLPPPARQVKLKLVSSQVFNTGIVSLEHAIVTNLPDVGRYLNRVTIANDRSRKRHPASLAAPRALIRRARPPSPV